MKKILLVILNLSYVIYTAIYASIGGFFGNESAMSTIGLKHPLLFSIWGILTFITLYTDIFIAYSKTKYKFYYSFSVISAVGMILTIICDFDYDKHTQYILHCIGSLTFSVLTGAAVFLLFVLTKKHLFAFISGTVLITDMIFLLIFKETALIELIPIFTGQALLIINILRKERKTVEIK